MIVTKLTRTFAAGLLRFGLVECVEPNAFDTVASDRGTRLWQIHHDRSPAGLEAVS